MTDVQSLTPERGFDDRFLDHLASAAEMVSEKRNADIILTASIIPG